MDSNTLLSDSLILCPEGGKERKTKRREDDQFGLMAVFDPSLGWYFVSNGCSHCWKMMFSLHSVVGHGKRKKRRKTD